MENIEKVNSKMVPQCDSLSRMLEAASVINQFGELNDVNFNLSRRHINYFKQALGILGLVTSGGHLTEAGSKALSLKGDQQRVFLKGQFERSSCGRAWMNWMQASTIDELSAHSADMFLEQRTDFPEAMIKRRGRTLRRWCQQLQSAQNQTFYRDMSIVKQRNYVRVKLPK